MTEVTTLPSAEMDGIDDCIPSSIQKIFYFPTPVVSDTVPIDATLPSSRTLSDLSVNPNLSLPHTCRRFLSFLPSPNSSFHLRRSARLPSASDEDGVISLRALSK